MGLLRITCQSPPSYRKWKSSFLSFPRPSSMVTSMWLTTEALALSEEHGLTQVNFSHPNAPHQTVWSPHFPKWWYLGHEYHSFYHFPGSLTKADNAATKFSSAWTACTESSLPQVSLALVFSVSKVLIKTHLECLGI